jgi:predicted GNAT superfamily acetyltransferase
MQVADSKTAVDIRPCSNVASWQRCVDLQREVWHFDPAELVPVHVLTVAFKTGGQVLGAFDAAGAQIGFALSFPALRADRQYLHSHMVAVLPEWQNRGVGRRLKFAQRDEALQRNLDVIEWTFDPLEARNAYFNVVRLGAVVRRYIPDLYGPSSSPLHRGLPTDRLLAEWHLKSPRVEAAVAGKPIQPNPGAVEISLAAVGQESSADVQARVRFEFTRWLGRGYAVTGFALHGETGAYLLEPYEN